MVSNYIKQDILEQLKSGNTEVLKGMSPVTALAYGLAIKDEKEQSKDINHLDENQMRNYMSEVNKPFIIATPYSITRFTRSKNNDTENPEA